MNRNAQAWSVFGVAGAVVFAVMAFLTGRMLRFERTAAEDAARAVQEENIRLALWRMDSAAGILLAQGLEAIPAPEAPREDEGLPRQTFEQRQQAPSQQRLSANEFRNRQQLASNGSLGSITGPVEPQAPDVDAETARWWKLTPRLLERVQDLTPGATLERVVDGGKAADPGEDGSRRLATIPARLVVPPPAPVELGWGTPVRLSLLAAWVGVGAAAVGVGVLLRATLALSERRGAFASAVTHELRTPLTTFRLYSELLASGVVSDEKSRGEYLNTLVVESDRLSQMVENVLAYSRLERKAGRQGGEVLAAAALVERAWPGLVRRAEQGGMEIRLAMTGMDGVSVRTDPVAVQQILGNLVDNACKYGKGPVEVSVGLAGEWVEVRVSDAGPGLGGEVGRRPFVAFSKRADDPAPGIGLGLYLSRQLARSLGGDLEYAGGSAFVLRLKRGDSPQRR